VALLLHRLSGAFAGALLLLLCSAGLALAGTPARVSVRVEDQTRTLVPSTTLTTTNKPVVKDGNPSHSCTGTSAAGALEQGTAGDWKGTYNSSFGYFIDSIKGVTPASSDYWTFWINNHEASQGICGIELRRGDDVLFFNCKGGSVGPNYACSNPPLGIQGPVSVRRGRSFQVRVVQFSPSGAATPISGARVLGGSQSVVSGTDGRATLTASSTGSLSLLAKRGGATPSGPKVVCVYAQSDGSCGTIDRTPPRVRIGGIREGQLFGARRGPRTLHGVARDSSGVGSVQLRLGRRVGGRCYRYDARTERLRRRTCRSTRAGFFSVGDRADWSYLLPSSLPVGRYVFDAVATDKNGNRSGLKLGVSRVVFYVGSRR